MRIIPAIDIMDGKCVRLTNGAFDTKKIYNEDPLEVAMQFEDAGITNVHIVDLDGAKAGRIVNRNILEKIAAKTKLHIDFGGGIKRDEDIKAVLEYGASQVTVGSIAYSDPELVIQWLDTFGTDRLILGADCNNRMICINGWHYQTGKDVIAFIKEYLSFGFTHVICTDISKDGTLQGPAKSLYAEIIRLPESGLIASGGITTLQDIHDLKDIGCKGAIIGKAIYEGRITLKQLRDLC